RTSVPVPFPSQRARSRSPDLNCQFAEAKAGAHIRSTVNAIRDARLGQRSDILVANNHPMLHLQVIELGRPAAAISFGPPPPRAASSGSFHYHYVLDSMQTDARIQSLIKRPLKAYMVQALEEMPCHIFCAQKMQKIPDVQQRAQPARKPATGTEAPMPMHSSHRPVRSVPRSKDGTLQIISRSSAACLGLCKHEESQVFWNCYDAAIPTLPRVLSNWADVLLDSHSPSALQRPLV
ncbi:hypothetical protein ACRALDRAFT_205658, partial [Sodiomyces alcalophilus JCM 7366]|uniref:uncharacterized protein n=1 Tax=Sodiomyces alcalophilus JCM 7366 TaxID=591952 RepID=UPI0039B4343F